MKLALCKYPGGKRQLAPRLLPLIPPHVTYVEPFCGAAGLLFAKPSSQVEILNDIDTSLVNAFRCIRYHPQAVIDELLWRINSRAEFSISRKCAGCGNSPATDIQRAASFLFRRALSFGADGMSFGVQKKQGGGGTTRLTQVRELLAACAARLDGVIIENLEWRRCLELYDSPETFFFCDPPYLGGAQKAYPSWTIQQLADLLSSLKAVKGKWLLTINDQPDIRRLCRGLRVREMDRARALDNRHGGHRYMELCISPRSQIVNRKS